MSDSLKLPPLDARIGDEICAYVEQTWDCPCHIVLAVCPQDKETGGLLQPHFITSLCQEDMEGLLIHIGNFMRLHQSKTDNTTKQ